MVELEHESVAFPVVLYDGEHEINVGNISIHPSLDFKQFQKMLKETVGISYNNLTTYLIESSVSKVPSERRRILITSKVSFSVLVLQTNCYFLVVLKRSRRDRRRKVSKPISFAPIMSANYLFHLNQNRNPFDLIDERISSGYGSYVYDDRFREYVNTIWNVNDVLDSDSRSNASLSTIERGRSRALCEDCSRAEEEGREAAFHFCVYDDVVAGGFRSAVGPISRPL